MRCSRINEVHFDCTILLESSSSHGTRPSRGGAVASPRSTALIASLDARCAVMSTETSTSRRRRRNRNHPHSLGSTRPLRAPTRDPHSVESEPSWRVSRSYRRSIPPRVIAIRNLIKLILAMDGSLERRVLRLERRKQPISSYRSCSTVSPGRVVAPVVSFSPGVRLVLVPVFASSPATTPNVCRSVEIPSPLTVNSTSAPS